MDTIRQEEVFGNMNVVYIYELTHAFTSCPNRTPLKSCFAYGRRCERFLE